MNAKTLLLTGSVLVLGSVGAYAWRVANPRIISPSPFLGAQVSTPSVGPVRPKPISDVRYRQDDGLHGVELTAERIGQNYLFLFRPWVPPASELYALDDPQTPVYVELHHDVMGMSNTYVMTNTSGVFSATIPIVSIEHPLFQTMQVIAWAAGADTSDPSQAFYNRGMQFVLQP